MESLRPVSSSLDAQRAMMRPGTAPVPQAVSTSSGPDDGLGSPLRAAPGTGRQRWAQLGGDFTGLGEAQLIRLVVRAEKENKGDSAEFAAALRVPSYPPNAWCAARRTSKKASRVCPNPVFFQALGSAFIRKGKLAAAEPMLERSLSMAQQIHGANSAEAEVCRLSPHLEDRCMG